MRNPATSRQPSWILRQRRAVIVLLLVLMLGPAALRPGRASAHANLVQSDPPAQAVLTRPPDQVQLVFSEAVDPSSIQVSVVDAQRQQVDQGNAALAPGANDTVVASLTPGVPQGVYTIQWKVVSAVDGHTTAGLVPFTIGPQGAIPAAAATATATESSSSGGVLGVVARWLTVLGAVALTGTFAFVPLIVAPGMRRLYALAGGETDPDVAPSTEAVDRVGAVALGRLLRIAGILLALFAVGAILLLLVEAAAGGPLTDAFGRRMWDLLTGTRRGGLWLVRAGIIIVMAVELADVADDVRRRGRAAVEDPRRWLILTALGVGTLVVQSLGSHAAALRSWEALAVAMDCIHLVAVAIWVGGLIQFGLALLPALAPLGGPPRTRLLAGLIPRFSRIAGASVAAIIATGIYQTIRLLGGWNAFIHQSWGEALLAKLVLFVVVLAFAAFNLLVVSPRLRKLAGRLDRPARVTAASVRSHFRRSVLGEAGLAVLILLAVGVLTGQSPGKAPSFTPAGPFRPFVLNASAEGLDGRLVLSPGRIGLNRFDLTVADQNGQPVPGGTEVVLRISTLDRDTGISEAKMDALGGGRFTTTGTYLSTVGLWQVAAVVRRPNVDEVQLPFQLSLTTATGQPEVDSGTPPPAVPVEQGRQLYQQNCAQCHGADARGDGPLAKALNPPPLDLTVHVPLHTNKELHDWIKNGIPRTAMPAWGDKFSDEEIQGIINYLRQVADQASQQR